MKIEEQDGRTKREEVCPSKKGKLKLIMPLCKGKASSSRRTSASACSTCATAIMPEALASKFCLLCEPVYGP